MSGFFVIHRELFDKPIWLNSTPEQIKVLILIIGLANHSGKQWEWQGKKFTCERGQFITSLPKLVSMCGKGVTIQNVRTALKRFEKLGFLTDKSTGEGRLITICNYSDYQDIKKEANSQPNSQSTDDQQTPNRRLTSTNNVNNNNNDNKNSTSENKFSDDHMAFAVGMFKLIRQVAPTAKEPNFEKWADDIRLINERDNRSLEEIGKVFRFANSDSFWKTNILSPGKLREKYTELHTKMINPPLPRKANHNGFDLQNQNYSSGDL